MKRIWILAATLLFILAGCSGKQSTTFRTDGEVSRSTPIAQPTAPEEPDEAEDSAQSGHGELTERQSGDLIEITEKMFIAQVNDVYLNSEDYLGKKLKYEGIFQTESWEMLDHTEEINYVIRYGPGCCGTDGNAGFEVVWDGAYPAQNEWVEVVGTLSKFDQDGFYYLQLILDSITVLDKRGAEYVSQ